MFLLQDAWIYVADSLTQGRQCCNSCPKEEVHPQTLSFGPGSSAVTPRFYHVKRFLTTIVLLLTPLFYHRPSQWCLATVASVPNLPYSMGLPWPLLLLWIFHLPWNKLSALGFFGFCFLVALLLTALFSFWATFPFSDVNHYFFQIFIFVFLHLSQNQGLSIKGSGNFRGLNPLNVWKSMYIYPSPPAFHEIHGGVQKSEKLRRTALCILLLYLLPRWLLRSVPRLPPFPLLAPQRCSHSSWEALQEYSGGFSAGLPAYPAASKVAQW